MLQPRSIILVASMLGASCAVYTSHPIDAAPRSGEGIPYSLPKRKLALRVTVETPSKDEGDKGGQAKTGKAKSSGSSESAGTQDPPTPKKGDNPASGPDTKKAAESGSTAASSSLPLHQWVGLSGATTVTITLLGYVDTPDHGHQYFLEFSGSCLSDDTAAVTIDGNGLLSSINTTSKDRTKDIVIEIARAVAAVGAETVGAAEPAPGKREAVIVFDPLNPVELARCNKQLKDGLRSPFTLACADSKQAAEAAPHGKTDGVLYRPVAGFELEVRQGQGDTDPTVGAIPFVSPNQSAVLAFPISRAAFVEKVTKLKFQSGILTSIEISKPSEVMSVVSLPLDLATAIMKVPAELLSIKVDYSSKEVEAAKNDAALLELQNELEKLREAND